MKKSELIKALESYPDDKEVYMTLRGSMQVFNVDSITDATPFSDNPCFETEEAPEFDDVAGMAYECFKDHKDKMTSYQLSALVDICGNRRCT